MCTITLLKDLKQLQENDARLVKQCLRGDRNSQRELYELHERDMFRICLRYAGSREEAEDMMQDGFVRIFQDLKQFKGEGPLGAWMHKVMVRSALQHLRKHASRPDFFEDVGKLNDYSHEEDLAGRLDAEVLTREIQTLPRGYRTVFNLFVMEEYTHEEIADTLGISVSTSKSQLHKARARLKKRLEQIVYSRA
jgi:RNA polymerase sigma-70 factor (ECF subfamily)